MRPSYAEGPATALAVIGPLTEQLPGRLITENNADVARQQAVFLRRRVPISADRARLVAEIYFGFGRAA